MDRIIHSTGITLTTGLNYQIKGFSDQELSSELYKLNATGEDQALITESCSPEEAEALLMPAPSLIAEAVTAVYNRLDSKMSALTRVFKRYLPDDIEIMAMPSIGPDRKNGLFAYKTVTFTFDDLQTVSILFHSPDNDPKKFQKDELLVAYRWLLNKRDITATVSPENGRDLDLQVMAKRIIQLLVANHDKFVKAQAKKDEETKALLDLEQSKADLNTDIDLITQSNADLMSDIESLDSRIESLKKQVADKSAPEVPESPAEAHATDPEGPESSIGDFGSKLDSKLSLTEVAKLIRKDIKAVMPGVKVSVRKRSSGTAIDADIVELPESTRLFSDEYLDYIDSGSTQPFLNGNRYTEEVKQLLEDLKKIGDQYRYDESDSMIDYFNTNFYFFEHVDTELGKYRLKEELGAYQAAKAEQGEETTSPHTFETWKNDVVDMLSDTLSVDAQAAQNMVNIVEDRLQTMFDEGHTAEKAVEEIQDAADDAIDSRDATAVSLATQVALDRVKQFEQTGKWLGHDLEPEKREALENAEEIVIEKAQQKGSSDQVFNVLAKTADGETVFLDQGQAYRREKGAAQAAKADAEDLAISYRMLSEHLKAVEPAEPDAPKEPETPAADSLETLAPTLAGQINNSLDTIQGIDDGSVIGFTRALFVSSIANKIKTQAKNGNLEVVEAALQLIADRNQAAAKPLITARNAIWKLAGKNMDYYMGNQEDDQSSGTESGNIDPETTNSGDTVMWRNEINTLEGNYRGPLGDGQNAVIVVNGMQMNAPLNELYYPDQTPTSEEEEQQVEEASDIYDELKALLDETDLSIAEVEFDALLDRAEDLGIDIDNDSVVAEVDAHLTRLTEEAAK